MTDKKRFETIYSQTLGFTQIVRDNETGVNYLWVCNNRGGGLTPLLNAQGNVVVTPVPHERNHAPEF